MVDDVVASGQSLYDAVLEVQNFGAEVIHTISIVDRLQGCSELFASKGIPYKSLLTIKDVLQA